MAGKGALALLLATSAVAQTHSTFYAAFEDGRRAERQGDWHGALAAYRRATALRPEPGARVIIYGNNLLQDYYPHTRMARCLLELKEWEGADGELALAKTLGEGKPEIQELAQRLQSARVQAPPAIQAPPPRPEPVVPPSPIPAPAPPEAPVEPAGRPEQPTDRPPGQPSAAVPPPQGPLLANPLTVPKPPGAPPAPVAEAPRQPRPMPFLPWTLGLAGASLVGGALWWRSRRRPAPPTMPSSQPDQVGPYRVERLLGRGGFASTYLAYHERTAQKVALKVLHPFRQDDPEFLGRFRQEARLGALLDHPNLVRMVEIGPIEGQAWLAMEFVAGERLDQYLKGRGPLPWREAAALALSIAAAMAHAHGLGIVHRDLKPSNVMVDEGQVRVMDFGIARILDSETLTTTYAFLGTPLYAAPEAQRKTQVGPASDRYSLGILLFELLAGRTPFQGETPFEILDHHRQSPLPDLNAFQPDLPTDLVALVEALCAKEPAERLEDAVIVARLTALLEAAP